MLKGGEGEADVDTGIKYTLFKPDIELRYEEPSFERFSVVSASNLNPNYERTSRTSYSRHSLLSPLSSHFSLSPLSTMCPCQF